MLASGCTALYNTGITILSNIYTNHYLIQILNSVSEVIQARLAVYLLKGHGNLHLLDLHMSYVMCLSNAAEPGHAEHTHILLSSQKVKELTGRIL